MEFLKGFADSFEEIHYLIGGISIGLILGIILTVALLKVLDNITGN